MHAFLAAVASLPFSYRPQGLTAAGPRRRGWVVDDNFRVLGQGPETWEAARRAVDAWAFFHQDWLSLYPARPALEPGTDVAVVAQVGPLWFVNACRVVAVLDESGVGKRRYGFSYGTLPPHAERGEERFSVTFDEVSGEVRAEILALSRPAQWFSAIGLPAVRLFQGRFARGALDGMARQVAADLR